jgi:hypothetical protein
VVDDLVAAAALLFAGLLVEHVVRTARAWAVETPDGHDRVVPEGMSGSHRTD